MKKSKRTYENRGRKGNGYLIFNCSGMFFDESTSIKEAAVKIGQNHKSVQNAVYQETALFGWVIIRKQDKPNSLIRLMEMCRERDNRWVIANQDMTKARYFNYKKDAVVYGLDAGWSNPIVCKASQVENYLPEKLYLRSDTIMPLLLSGE
jgi:hypothetical protein